MRRLLLAALALCFAGQVQAQQISQLPSASAFNDSDLFAATQGYTAPGTGVTRKVSGSLLRSWMSANQSLIWDGFLGSTRGSVAYRGATGWGSLVPGTAGYVLTSNGSGADPSYQAVPGGTLAGLSDVTLSTPTNGQALVYNTGSSKWVNQSVGSGSVTSVTFTGDGTVLSSTPSSAVTTSGTVTASLATQSANRVLAGPTSGGAVAPTFRALVAGDLPTGTATSSSTIPLNNDARLNVIEIPFSFSGGTTIAASVPVVRVVGAANGISIAANPTWYSWCDTLPTASMTFTLKQRHSGSTTSIGNIVIGTGGTVTSSPTWSAVTLAQGEAIIVTSPSSADATANGCGLVVVGARL